MQDEIINSSGKQTKYIISHKQRTDDFPQMEEVLAAWVNKLREENKVVLGVMLKSRALAIFSDIYQMDPSNG